MHRLIRCERVNRAAVAADHERGVPSDDTGALPGRSARAARRAHGRRARDRGARAARRRAAAAARRARPRHRDHHQVHLHRDHGHARHRQPPRRAAHHRSKAPGSTHLLFRGSTSQFGSNVHQSRLILTLGLVIWAGSNL